MDHDARKTVGNDTGRSLHLCPVGNGLCAIPILRRGVEHVFDENTISGGRIVDKDVGHRAHQFAILNDGATGHFCVK